MSGSRRPSPSPSAPTVGERELRSLVDAIASAIDLHPGDPARMLRVRATPEEPELELGFRELEPGAHPLEDLVGFDAPDDWAAIGVACTGKARHLDDPAAAVPVAIVQLVSRAGAWASSWTPLVAPGETAIDPTTDPVLREAGTASGRVPGSASGRVDDALRLALGLRTAPPAEGTARLWASLWLDELLTTAALEPLHSRRRRSLAALVAAHPAIDAFGLDPTVVTIGALIGEGAKLAGLRTWSLLRLACAARRWEHPEVGPSTAAWLDDGAFSRWVLGAYPELGDLRAVDRKSVV